MTGLALILSDLGAGISGSDADDSHNLRILRGRSERMVVGHGAEQVPEETELLVYSSAVPADNPERQAAMHRGIPAVRRGECLAELARCFRTIVAVAGSHGKTTVTAMLAWLMRANGGEAGYLIGGQPLNLALPAAAGRSGVLITEVDESDGTQALMHPHITIVTNVDDDHCWSLGGEAALDHCFRTLARQSRALIVGDAPRTRELFGDHPEATWIDDAAVPAASALPLPGHHNRLNAALAMQAAEQLGATPALSVMAQFEGVERRQTLRYAGQGLRVIEDYAHHPVEVAATLQGLREERPRDRLRVVFQPHRYERVARYADAFARELSAADEVIVVEPFSAWLTDDDLADPRRIVDGIRKIPARYAEEPYAELAQALAESAEVADSIVILGAGSVTRLVPLLIAELTARSPE